MGVGPPLWWVLDPGLVIGHSKGVDPCRLIGVASKPWQWMMLDAIFGQITRMTAWMDENKPFQASKWFRLASKATMLTQNKPSEGFRRFGLATMTAWMDGPTSFRFPQGLRRFDLTPNVGHRCQSTPPCNGSRVFVHASMLSS